MQMLPRATRVRLGTVDFFCGTDPVYAGLHRHQFTSDGRRYSDTAHAACEAGQQYDLDLPASERRSTIVLPKQESPWVVVHELGHILDERIGFRRHTPEPVSDYARANTWEAFAEAFTVWVAGDEWLPKGYYSRDVLMRDGKTMELFKRIDAAQ